MAGRLRLHVASFRLRRRMRPAKTEERSSAATVNEPLTVAAALSAAAAANSQSSTNGADLTVGSGRHMAGRHVVRSAQVRSRTAVEEMTDAQPHRPIH